MFVAVFLVDAKVHTVIPQEFVYELIHENLFNKGVNSNQNRLIYFSKELFDVLQDGASSERITFVPNYNLPVTKVYPLPTELEETCFIARLKKFFGMYKNIKNLLHGTNQSILIHITVNFDDALCYIERLRAHLPALYNSLRENELPIPPVDVLNDDEVSSIEIVEETFDQNNESEQEEDVKPTIFEQVQLETCDVDAFDTLFNNGEDEEEVDTINEVDPLANDKSVIGEQIARVDQVDDMHDTSVETIDEVSNTQAMQNNIQHDKQTDESTGNEVAAAIGSTTNDQADQVVSDTNTNSQIIVKLDDDLEYIYTSIQDFRPYVENEFQIKANDALSNNRPFKKNVRFIILFSLW